MSLVARTNAVSELLANLGFEVIVANARRVELISKNHRKGDLIDAELLARLGRVDRELLAPVQHRARRAQVDLTLIRMRDGAVRARTKLINSVRGTVKAFGFRVPSCSSRAFHRRAIGLIPEEIRGAVKPVLECIEALTEKIKAFDKSIEATLRVSYAEAEHLLDIAGVGPVTALAFILTLDDPKRFKRSRQVPAFLGLVPKRDQSVTRTNSFASLRQVIGISARSLCSVRNTFLVPSVQIRTFGSGA